MKGLAAAADTDRTNSRHEEIDRPKAVAWRVLATVEHGRHYGLVRDQKTKGHVGKGIRIFG